MLNQLCCKARAIGGAYGVKNNGALEKFIADNGTSFI